MTYPLDPTTPNEVNDLLGRLNFTDLEVELSVELGQDADPALEPRTVQMSDDMDRRVAARAVRLGLSKSAYIRSLIERDLARPRDA
ncbi:hypothetical protein [Nocardia sp. NPDC056100]|uniref:hypothetical protein n=1 Tax=Nocardia sp. NPDC056100 TaxID=3345712 RepID=UPI0035DEAE98